MPDQSLMPIVNGGGRRDELIANYHFRDHTSIGFSAEGEVNEKLRSVSKPIAFVFTALSVVVLWRAICMNFNNV